MGLMKSQVEPIGRQEWLTQGRYEWCITKSRSKCIAAVRSQIKNYDDEAKEREANKKEINLFVT